MREALEHMNHKNDTLTDELTETRKLLKLHKQLLQEALENQAASVD